MALSRGDALVLAERGGSVVWSPRSNLDLYGATAPVALLSSLGVRIALGTDWLASGSMSLLRELACVRDYDARVLGGHFDRGRLWRLVTENPAWALGLERRLGELRAGLVGDIAVFSERDDAMPETDDVRLVLRQGAPLYGDAELVSAFDGGIACDQLEVCGRPRRACVGETGLNLGQILEAGEAVYPLWSCTTPEHEPSCSATVSRECPFGENECEAPPLEPDIARRDTDGDGVADHDDTCPRTANPDQADRDADGRGDVCDPCPVPNLGLSPCPVTVAELRAPRTRLPLGSAVLLTQVRVTALRLQGAKGFYLEDGTHAPYSGLFAYTDGKKPDVEPGDIVSVQGYFGAYQGSDELLEVEVLERASGASAYAPLAITAAEISDGSPQAAGFASLLVRVTDLEVSMTNPDAPNDYDETGLAGALRLDDLLYPELDNTFALGTRFAFAQGITGRSFSHQKLWPRQASDLAR
jgi:hypothetical protein